MSTWKKINIFSYKEKVILGTQFLFSYPTSVTGQMFLREV